MEYGETPWDDMNEKELRLEVWKLYKAAESARSCLRVIRVSREMEPYWNEPRGAGYHALNILKQAMSTGLDLTDEDQEILWKGFFRNALPLMFKGTNWEWHVCEPCEAWVGDPPEGRTKPATCPLCKNKDLRPIKWTDFRKEA